jgi:hypothetical protein
MRGLTAFPVICVLLGSQIITLKVKELLEFYTFTAETIKFSSSGIRRSVCFYKPTFRRNVSHLYSEQKK